MFFAKIGLGTYSLDNKQCYYTPECYNAPKTHENAIQNTRKKNFFSKENLIFWIRLC